MPPDLQGSWQSQCSGLGTDRMTFRSDDASLGPGVMASCRLVGGRKLGDRRWYLDFACADGRVVEIDVLQVSASRLLVSPRPLGEACELARVSAGEDR